MFQYSKFISRLFVLMMLEFMIICVACSSSNNKIEKELTLTQIPTREEVHELNTHEYDYTLFRDKDGVIDFSRTSLSQMRGDSLPKHLKDALYKIDTSSFFHHMLTSYNEDIKINLKIDDGWMIGFDCGEWGGYLYWFSDDGEDYQEINRRNILSLDLIKNEVFAFEGLLHLGDDGGSLMKVEKIDTQWVANEILKLEEAPLAATVYDEENFIIATKSRLLKIVKSNNSYSIESIIEKGFWNYIYPNSILIEDNFIYVGMRGGIMRVDMQDAFNVRWLKE